MPKDTVSPNLINTKVEQRDPDLFEMIEREYQRQDHGIELIASENIVSKAVLAAQGSVLTNKYAEGYPGRRYYGGCVHVDEVEKLAIERAKKLFNSGFANVQPHSGSQANQAVFMALLKPGDLFMGMSLDAGGHLTHGAKVNQSGKWFNSVHYGVRETDMLINYDDVEKLAKDHRPKMIIAGGSAYSRPIDFKKFREIADEIEAILMVDMAHYAGLIAAGEYPSPIEHAHVCTTTTHKTLRGPRGGMVLCNDETIAKKVNSALFPGIQGGPLMHVIAAKAVAFGEALDDEFKGYAKRVIENARQMAKTLQEGGVDIVSGGTDSHLMLIDLRSKNVRGNDAEEALERAGITCNKNGVPFDPTPPMITSGLRVGSPAATSRGFGPAEFEKTAQCMIEIIDSLAQTDGKGNPELEKRVEKDVKELCAEFPIY